MKNLLTIIMVLITPTMVAPTSNTNVPIKIPVENKVEVIKDIDLFLHDMGHRESGNRYDIVNQFGYMGKYQFGKATLRTLKIKVTKDAF